VPTGTSFKTTPASTASHNASPAATLATPMSVFHATSTTISKSTKRAPPVQQPFPSV
jgi:hypothetical protein